MRDSIAARVDELTVITPEALDNVEFALRDVYHGSTSHADIDVVKVGHRKDVYRCSAGIFTEEEQGRFALTLLLNQGENLRLIQSPMNHKSLATTMPRVA